MHREVAIKTTVDRFTERFEREARAIAALNHPNVCTLYDVGPDYLIMELVEGPTLADRIRAGAISLDESLKLAAQIADALSAAHRKGVIHRDLKPGNIKVTPDGRVKVLDFGLAKVAVLDGSTDRDAPYAVAESPTLTIQGDPTPGPSACAAGAPIATIPPMSENSSAPTASLRLMDSP